MAKLRSSFKNMFLSLTLICVISAGMLASVNELTKNPIAEAKKQKLENAVIDVVPQFDNDPVAEMYKVDLAANDIALIYPAKLKGELVGLAVETRTMKGFSGEIRILTGITPEGKIINYTVLHHAETPGLGDKMDPWFKTEKANRSILGKDLSQQSLSVSKQGGTVDAITAATITSVAFLDAVNKAYRAYKGKTEDADSGATSN